MDKKPSRRDKDKDKTKKRKDVVGVTNSAPTKSNPNPVNVLCVDSDDKNWVKCFEGYEHNGRPIKVTKTRWENMIVNSELTGRAIVNMKPNEKPTPGTDEHQNRQVIPDCVVVRKLIRGLSDREDYTNALYGLMFAGLPAVNSLESCHMCLERPVVTAALNGIKRRVGADKFPLIDMSYYSHSTAMLFTPELPVVAKIGSAEAGYGKMMFKEGDSQGLTDLKSVIALHHDFVTLERYMANRVYDIRVQKIGNNYRAFKRTSSNWKGNVGTSHLEVIPMTDQFRLWGEEAGKLFGGMDILTVDAIHTADGKDYILEINDSPSGFLDKFLEEDMGHVRDLVLEKLKKEVK